MNNKFWEISFSNESDYEKIIQYSGIIDMERNPYKLSLIMLTKKDGRIMERTVKHLNITEYFIEEVNVNVPNISSATTPSPQYVSKKRLKKMGKWFKNKEVIITYEYNNSMNYTEIREYIGSYDEYDVIKIDHSGFSSYVIKFLKKEKVVFEQDFQYYAEFTGLGRIGELTAGPYCYFTIQEN